MGDTEERDPLSEGLLRAYGILRETSDPGSKEKLPLLLEGTESPAKNKASEFPEGLPNHYLWDLRHGHYLRAFLVKRSNSQVEKPSSGVALAFPVCSCIGRTVFSFIFYASVVF